MTFKPSNFKIYRKNYFTGNNISKTYSIKYEPQSWTSVISFVKKYNIKLWIFRIFLKFLLVCPNTDFFRKLSDIAFAFIMPYHAKTSPKKSLDQGQGYKSGCIILAQIGSKLSILAEKRYFGKIDCYHCMPTVYFHAKTF